MDESQHEDDPTPMADSISQELLDSSSALQALGRGLAPIVAAALAEGRPGGVSQMTTSGHVPGAYPFPSMGAYPSYSPVDWSMYGYDNRFQYGPSGRFQYGSSSRSQYGLPVGAQHAPLERSQYPPLEGHQQGHVPRPARPTAASGGSSSGLGSQLSEQGDPPGLLAPLVGSGAHVDGDWYSLVDPHVSQEEQDDLDGEDGVESDDQGSCDPPVAGKEDSGLHSETTAFLETAFGKTASFEQRKKWLEKFPRPANACANPPSIDKPIFSLVNSSSSQNKKKILSHDRFLVKLQRYASDAVGPLSFLLGELQAGRPVPAEKAIQAVQAALCCVGNSFAHLSVERRKSILQHLNTQLLPMAEEECPNEGKLFGPDFGKKAKDRVDAMKSLASTSSVFFRLGDPQDRRKENFKGQGSRGKGPYNRFTPYNRKGGSGRKSGSQSRPAPKKGQ